MASLFSSPQSGGQNTASLAMRKVTSDDITNLFWLFGPVGAISKHYN